MFEPSPIVLQADPPTLEETDPSGGIIGDKSTYAKSLKRLQKQILSIQQAYYHQGLRAIIVFEGWDASGKGGAIRRLTERLDPRGVKVHPIGTPTADEQGRHYLYRFQTRLPIPGTWSIFDRSWYGRVLVERIEGFAATHEWQRAYQEINEYERMLRDDGVRIVKIFLHISKDEQLRRFEERLHNPNKRWKLTSEDIRNRERWGEYTQAIDEMFLRTSTESVPWQIIAANHKWHARIEVLKTIASVLAKGIDTSPPELDPKVVAEAEQRLGITLPAE